VALLQERKAKMDTDLQSEFNRLMRRAADDLGWNDMNMRRDRPYLGQEHTSAGTRGKTEVKGITFRDLRDCFVRACCHAGDVEELSEEANKGEDAALCENDLYKLDWDKIDPMAVFQNLACEVEKIMGIYPNVQKLIGE
jgi:hypothetical protein